MKKGKQLAQIAICIVLIAVATGVGTLTHVFDSFSDALASGFKLDVLLKLLIMVCFVVGIEKLLVLILSLFKGGKSGTSRLSSVITIISSLIKYGSAIIIICWGLSIIGVDVSTIAASVGIVALIVGFGAESLIEDVITGVFMLFENQYNVGDIVEVSGFRGTVTDIGIRTTSITDPGGNVKIINNSNMKDILNRSDNASKAISDIGIPYETDLEAFEKELPSILSEIYQMHEDKMNKEPVYLGVQALGDSSVTLRFMAEVNEKDVYSVQRILNHDLFVLFKKHGVEVPFPQVDVHQK